ncbi:MAG: hypothetical protein Q7T80_14860 [Methanoregula sp.]|nr:hypothetical protein [Methanoregula sp.]
MAKQIFAALKQKCVAAIEWFTSASSVASDAKPVPVTANGNVLDMGKRYRLRSGHAPLFSLFTFFKNSY